jgi:hypothetical protein
MVRSMPQAVLQPTHDEMNPVPLQRLGYTPKSRYLRLHPRPSATRSREATSPSSQPAPSFSGRGCLEGSLGLLSFQFLSEKKNVEKMVCLTFLSSQFTALW